MTSLRGILILALGIFSPGGMQAQNQPLEVDSCLIRIASSSYSRVPVFLQATPASHDSVILPAADLLAQSVAFRMRELLKAEGSQLPEGDSVVDWKTLWGEVIVTAHRTGAFTWSVPEWSQRADTASKSSLVFLKRAMTDIASSETIAFPADERRDSLHFSLSFIRPSTTKGKKLVPIKSRQAFPAFSLMVPWEKPVELTEKPRIFFPTRARATGVEGMVRLTFVVDQTGHVMKETIAEVWPEGAKRPTPDMIGFYNSFLQAVKAGILSGRYSPAVVGGCPLKQRVEQDFDFRLWTNGG